MCFCHESYYERVSDIIMMRIECKQHIMAVLMTTWMILVLFKDLFIWCLKHQHLIHAGPHGKSAGHVSP